MAGFSGESPLSRMVLRMNGEETDKPTGRRGRGRIAHFPAEQCALRAAQKSPARKLTELLVWRRSRDLNPGAGFPAYSLSRGAPSATWVLLQAHLGTSPGRSKNARRERDSNPRCLATSLVFKTSAFNRSAISPWEPAGRILSYSGHACQGMKRISGIHAKRKTAFRAR